jgi:signal transduction histidine kinase
LNVIQMSAAVTLLQTSPGQEGERARSSAERIIRSAQRMASLIKDLLDVSSIEAGRLAVHLEEHGLETILSETLEVNLPLAAEKSVRLQREGEMLSTHIRCDRERILQVLGNLVGNAIKFTPEGGLISVGVQVEPDRVVFAVRDTGSGILDGDLPHLFEPYWQSKTLARQKTGIGLGLAICKGIVEAHGGTIWADSKEGEGSSFFFTLPLAPRKPQG